MLQQLEKWLQFDFQIKMASHLLRKRRQAVSPSKRLQKYLRAGWSQTENNDFQENFCVYCNCEMDDSDCVVVSEKIVKERGRCQNPACISDAAVKLQRASRRIQEFYGHSYREGQIWKICKVCYLRAEQHLEELIPVEINCTPEDDDSYGDDDVIVLETVQSLHNHSDALTKRQPNVGELRTFVKFAGENSLSSIKTDVMNGSIIDKGNTDVPRAPVHSDGTSETLEVINTKKSGRELLSQNHQAFSQGDVTECTPVQYVPFQQLLQQGLSVFGAQSGIANYQEGLENKQQQPSTQLSKGHINEQEPVELHHTLQERFCVLKPSATTTDFGQEKQQESHQLQQQLRHQYPGIQHSMSLAHRHFDGPRMTKSSSCNITHISKQISEQVFQKTCVLKSAAPQMLNGHPASVSYRKQDEENVACEQCIQLVAPLTIGSTPPLPNNQQEDKSQFLPHSNEQNVVQTIRSHNEHIISKDMSHHDSQTVCQHQQLSHEQSVQQNSTLFLTPTLLQQGGQHVISGVQDSRVENTQKQSIQQTASEMSSSPSEKCLLHPSHPAGQSLVSTQQQPSELASQPVQQQSGQCNQQSVSLSPQQSSEDIALKITNQYSGQIMVQILGLCNQKCTPQSVHSEPHLLTQQPQQQKKQAESHITIAMEIQNQREMGSYLLMTSDSNVPRSPLISSKPVCMNLCMTVEPPETQGPIISELGLNQLEKQQQQWQQKQNTPSSILQEPQEHIPTAESDTDSHVERALLSVSNRDLLQNRSQPLQHLENSQSEQTELKLEPVIPLQKSQEGNPQYSDKQVSSSGSASQLVYQQLCASLTNNIQMVECVSQPSVVCQFPAHLSVMCQEQQVKMLMGFTCDILAQFLPTVMQQQLQKDSDKVEVAPSLMKTDGQNLKVISNPDDLRLPDEEENEISDTESMCQSLADSLSSNLSSTESDRSVSDFAGGYAEKDVVPLGNVVIEESHLPPLGMLYRPPVAVGDSVYVMNDIKRPWVLGTVQDIASKINKTYTVECLNSKNRRVKKTIKEVTGYQLAYPKVQDFRFSVGHRIISIFRNGNSDEEYYSGVIAESPKSINHYRYLVFFDKGSYQYVKHEDICLVVDGSQSMWEAVPKETRDFVQNYLEKYPERAMLKVQGGQHVSTEWNGIWYNAKVIEVDASLALMSFPPKGKYVEWIYRGSARFYPLFEARNRTCKKQFARTRAFARKVCVPYIQYTVKDEEELDRKIKEERESAMEESEPPYHFTARMNTSSQITAQNLQSAVTPPKRKFYPCYSQVTYKAHICKPSCVVAGSSDKDYGRYQNLWSHLSEPLLYGWTREKVKYSDCVSVYYRAPCKSRLRNIEELHKYLLRTKSKFTVDQFDFNHWVRCFSELINEESFIKIEDISNGVEAVPVPCINTVDSRVPDKIMYVTKHVPTNGTYIETDPEFLTCCNCTDDCLDKEKCACWRQTLEGVKYGSKTESLSNEGYYYKRLYEPLGTGIYECNSRCKCSSTCLNRLVQLPMKCKTQIFMTPNLGWGVRTLHDIPKGSYICLYAGLVLPEKVGDALAEEDGDEYQADLNYIEDAEKIKEYYEENPYENELDVLCGKRPNSKRKGQTTTSRKLTGKMYKIVTPSTRVLFGRNARYILDAKTCGNVGRFINHSCNPNLFVQNVFVDTHDLRFPFVAFFTNSFVPANTELTWNYGYDVGSVPGRTIICKCGEANCQGRLL